jgi:hypothetical protein
MNNNLKTVLLTILTLSMFTLAMIEISGISTKAIFNKFKIGKNESGDSYDEAEAKSNLTKKRTDEMHTMPPTTVKFVDEQDSNKIVHDFGTIKDGDKVKWSYKFTNTGDKPLMIANVTASCGCTAPSYNKELVMPGKDGEITIEFNSKGKSKDGGIINKSALVDANILGSPFPLTFTAKVIE